MVLCDLTGVPQGTADLFAAHAGDGQLHLAFSVYVFSPDHRRLLLQQRSREKKLWPLFWANTCCSHPFPGETALAAGQRRLQEEMGFTCRLNHGPAFVYRAADPHGNGVEHEYDVILAGTYAGDPVPDPAEVADWKWVDLGELQLAVRAHPERYTPWLQLGLPKLLEMSV